MKKLTVLKIAACVSIAGAVAVNIATLAMPADINVYTYGYSGEVQKRETVESKEAYTSENKQLIEYQGKSQMPTCMSSANKLDLSEDDRYLLAKLVMAEAEDEPFTGQACVALVVLNRVKDPEFPDNVYDVIFQPGQFTPISNGRWDEVEPDDSCKAAVHLVGTGWDESEGATYFEAVNNASDWHENNLVFLFKKGTHKFYKA